jgi:hypothetical protein
LVARLVRDEKVAGSNPVSPTKSQFLAVSSCLRNTPRSPPSAGFLVSASTLFTLLTVAHVRNNSNLGHTTSTRKGQKGTGRWLMPLERADSARPFPRGIADADVPERFDAPSATCGLTAGQNSQANCWKACNIALLKSTAENLVSTSLAPTARAFSVFMVLSNEVCSST